VLNHAGSRVRFSRSLHKTAYTVRPYRPRIEGMFARIERWTNNATGLSHMAHHHQWQNVTHPVLVWGTTAASTDADGQSNHSAT